MICSPYGAASLVSRTALQAGVIRRDQAEQLSLTRAFARNQLKASRWTQWGDHVLLMQNSPPSRRQLMLIAVLDVGYPAALASHTALELAGFTSFANEADDVHIIIPHGARCHPLPGVRVHESRRLRPELHVQLTVIPCTDVARSAIDAAAWQPWPRFACALVAAVVQQRLCTGDELDQAMQHVGRVRHKAHLREAIRDIQGGSHALSEIDLIRLCRRFGIQEPDRQVKRFDSHGRLRYLDAEWKLSDGRRVVLEVDGAHHLDVQSWQADMRRERGLVVRGDRVLRATAIELRVEPVVVVADLCAIGVPRVVSASGRQSNHQR
ncbi:MAG TPA: hypothetical protein VJN19_06455 [Propionibacteriaceae bacterium]|nr:hypothetical protein [Propionibacteriaceae bacterium]